MIAIRTTNIPFKINVKIINPKKSSMVEEFLRYFKVFAIAATAVVVCLFVCHPINYDLSWILLFGIYDSVWYFFNTVSLTLCRWQMKHLTMILMLMLYVETRLFTFINLILIADAYVVTKISRLCCLWMLLCRN